jgi:hypothetical protein
MKIAILVEGETEQAFKQILIRFLKTRLTNKMPKLKFYPFRGRIPKGNKLKRIVNNYLRVHDAVIALTDVYTGTTDFTNAYDAKRKMSQWVEHTENFYPHVACYDFESWLIPYWNDIQKIAGHNKSKPTGQPETINHHKPPAFHVKEIFELGKCRSSYKKPRDGMRILKDKDLLIAINACPELKAFLNTILRLSRGTEIP